jgi:hypothetical protein
MANEPTGDAAQRTYRSAVGTRRSGIDSEQQYQLHGNLDVYLDTCRMVRAASCVAIKISSSDAVTRTVSGKLG